MNEAFKQLASTLQKSGSVQKAERQGAEQTLRQMSVSPGFGIVCLRFVTLPDVPSALKQAACVTFKNMVKDNWSAISDGDKTQIKASILPLLLSGPPPELRSLLGAAVALIAQSDFPAQWTNLVSDMVNRANPQDYSSLIGVLRTAHSVFRRYRNVSASTEVLKELKFILDQFQRPLLSIFVQTWQHLMTPPAPDVARMAVLLETANLCTKVFYDLNSVDLPEFFEDHMKEWMTGFLQALKFQTAAPQLIGDDDSAGIVQKLQKNVCMSIALYATKYDEEFAGYLEGFVQGVWQLLTDALAKNKTKFDSIVAHGVAFLTAVANGAHHALFSNGEIMKSICEKIVIPCMQLRKSDVELFEDDPMEYVTQDIEGSDLDTRRRSAKELVKGLRKSYEKQVTQIFGNYIETLLSTYASNPKANWKAKDVAVYLLTAVAVSTFRQMSGAGSVNPMVPLIPFYQSNIVTDLANGNQVHPILQADALKFVITFRSQIPVTEYGRLLPLVVGMLRSPVVVVHTYAACALDNMLTVRDPNPTGSGYTLRISKENLEPVLKDLLGGLFGVFKANGGKPNQYVIKAVMRVVSKAKEKMAPMVQIVREELSGLLRNVIANQQSPVYNHYLFECIAALIGCAAVGGGPPAVTAMEASLMPMFTAILQQDIGEFSGYVYQLLSQLLSEQKDVPESYWGSFPTLLNFAMWERPGNAPALARLLGEYVAKGAAKIAGNEPWMISYLTVWQQLNSMPKYDVESFDLLSALTSHMPLQVLDKYLPQMLSVIFARLSHQKGKTPRYIRGFVTWILQFAAKHGGSAIVLRCNKVQGNIWVNCVNLICTSIRLPRSHVDKKMCALGAVKLLTSTEEMLVEPHLALWNPLLLALMGLFELPDEEENAEFSEDQEISGGAVFAPLFHAGTLTEKDLFPGVIPQQELAKGLALLNQKTQGKAASLIQLPPEAGQKLQSYFQAANVRL